MDGGAAEWWLGSSLVGSLDAVDVGEAGMVWVGGDLKQPRLEILPWVDRTLGFALRTPVCDADGGVAGRPRMPEVVVGRGTDEGCPILGV
ncbi:hypothetical protein RchiOBHm_Chr3g0456111 [Rosa chinensis]|uniref:Uncharacterized protein n=1 Tax=Rosa chinensis TaxID=74649 RepID=A0A2P6R785_ROSCH|nr:hypothetical protein RchiOBHm_Chr3g0456111 [Rosa chinensis]